jgi:hypothetical protein
MDGSLDLAEIAESSRMAPRKLRYVLDHGLLPAGKIASRGRGAIRRFTGFEAFGLATAALMLEAGLRRALVRDCLAALCRAPGRDVRLVPLYCAYAARGAARLEVGDWAYARLVVAGAEAAATDTGWLPLAGAAAPAEYTPLVTLTLDVAQVRGRVVPRR